MSVENSSGPTVVEGEAAQQEVNEEKHRQELAKRARFQEQCFLMFHKDRIVQQLTGQRRLNLPPTPSGDVTVPIFTYDHVVALHAQQGDTIASQLQSVDGASAFFNLDSAVLSQLKPRFELYKIYPRMKASDVHHQTPLRVMLPLGEVHEDTSATQWTTQESLGGSNVSSFASIDELCKGYAEGGFLGFAQPSNVSITFGGKDPAQVNIIDDFQFTLYFSSFQLFNHVFQSSYIDPTTQASEDINWSYKDLISWSEKFVFEGHDSKSPIPTRRKISDADLLGTEPCADKPDGLSPRVRQVMPLIENAHYFEIQAVVRYDDQVNFDIVESIAHDESTILSSLEQEEIKNFLRSSALVVRLQFKEHEIFYPNAASADPSLTVKFRYAAYLDSILRSPDLNIIEAADREQAMLSAYMNNLAQAEKLLMQVKARELTLKSAIESNVESGYINEIAESYVSLRQQFVGGRSAWSIRLPYDADGFSRPYGSIIVSQAEAEQEVSRADRDGREPTLNRYAVGDLILDKDKRPIDNKENAVKIFEELVKKYQNYVSQKRRAYRSARYGRFFEFLYGRGRIYKILALPEEVGLEQGGEVANNEAETAEWRKIELETGVQPGTGQQRRWNILGAHPVNPRIADEEIDDIVESFAHIIAGHTRSGLRSNEAVKSALRIELIDAAGNVDGTNLAGPLHPIGPMTYVDLDGKRRPAKTVYFTTLGDIVDIAVDLATAPNSSVNDEPPGDGGLGLFARRMGLLFGPLIDHNTGTSRDRATMINLSQVPISLKTLMSFWVDNVLMKDREEYLLGQFITDLITKLTTRALGEKCIEDGGRREESVKLLHFTSAMQATGQNNEIFIPPFYPEGHVGAAYPEGGASNVLLFENGNGRSTALGLSANGTVAPLRYDNGEIRFTDMVNASPNTPLEEQFNYMLFYVHNYIPAQLRPSDREQNIARGIYYLEPGRMTSVIKNINFARTEIPWLREARLTSVRTPTGGTALKDVYDATITLYGNNIFKPGMIVFIDPTREGGTFYNQWKDLGIGGFYIIISVDHMVLSDDVLHETIMRAKWISFGECGSSLAGSMPIPVPIPNSFPGTVPEEYNGVQHGAIYRPQPSGVGA